MKGTILALGATNSTSRIVIATIAFGMGLDIPDIHPIVHMGSSSEVELYEGGRGGWNGQPTKLFC